jgi:trimeric autotransporter adhesin
MKKKLFLLPFLLFFIQFAKAQVEQVTENQIGISKRIQFDIDNAKDPALGYVPQYRLVQAYTQRKQQINSMNAASRASLFSWTERGPYTDVVGPSNGNGRPGNGKTSGRVRAIWEDLRDATGKTVWVGGIDGGLWKTTDITLNPATWTPINDFFGNLAVASICQDPTDGNILYFGTGEKALNADAVRGAGIWRTIDGGANWAVIPGSELFYNVSKISCDATGNLYVGNNTTNGSVGMQRYTKATGTWANITPSGLDTRITDIEISSTGRLHISCGYYNTAAASSGYRFTDNPATVTSGTWASPTTTFTTQYNVDIASVGNTLYVLPSNASFQVATIYKSTDGGANWAAIVATPAFTSGQSWYNMAIAIDPNNANNVIVGALDCYKTTNGGGSWTKISEWVGSTGQYVHADQQIITWRNNNQVLIGCDGGVFYSANGGTTITDRNEGLRIKQFYSVAIHPTSTNYFLAGAQDNGTHQLNGAGLASSVEVTGGDGAYVAIDQDQPQYQWGAYVYNQYRRSSDGGNTWSSINYSSTAGKFINPFDYDDAANIMYASGNANTYIRWSNAQTGSTFTAVTMSGLNGGKVSAIKVSPFTSNTVYFGGGGSGIAASLIKATSANGTAVFTNIIGNAMAVASTNISSIEFGTTEQNIIVTVSNYGVNNVWVTNDGGTTWNAVDGNLPDMPVRWAMFYPGTNNKAIIATETGVWQTELINNASTLWDPETSFPNVRTDMLQYRASDGLLAASTHGRGLFTTIIGAIVTPTCGNVAGLTATSITNTSATLNWAVLSGANNYDVDYKLATATIWANAATATTNTNVAISALTQGTIYDYRVRANCTGATGTYTQAQFTTTAPATCTAPTGLNASSITATGATLNWAAVSGAVNYDIDYKLTSATTWTNAATATTTTSRTIAGLTASTTYDFRVRTNCSGLSSGYTQAQFTTTAATSACPGIYDISTNGTVAGAGVVPFNTDVKGTISANGDIDYYKFVVTTGGTATITLSTLPGDYDIRLYSSNGTTQLAASELGGTSSETISRTYTAGTYYLRVFGYNGANSATVCYTLKVQLGTAAITGSQEFATVTDNKTSVKVFPNPTTDKLNIYLLGDNTQKILVMYDVNGKKMYAQNITDMITTLDVQKISTGIYYIKIMDTNGNIIYTEKFVKK